MTRLDANNIPLTGLQLIEASAGTGKTYTITTLLIRLLVESGLSIREILVVTFTEAATAELKERIRTRLQQALKALTSKKTDDDLIRGYLDGPDETRVAAGRCISRALSDFDEASVFTIHGFCKRMLEENAFESGVLFDAELVKDQNLLLTDIVHDFWARETCRVSPAFIRYLHSKNVHPAGLIRFATTVSSTLDTRLLPSEVKTKDAGRAFAAAFERAKNIWRADRDRVIRVLLEGTALKANIYKPARMQTWFEEIDTYFERGESSAPILPSRTLGKPPDHGIAKLAASRLAKGTKKNHAPPDHPFFHACEEILSVSGLFEEQFIAFKLELAKYTAIELKRRKQEIGIWSFDDLLAKTDRAIQSDSGPQLIGAIRARFRAALIDEFQDTDKIQYRIFSALYRDRTEPLFLIGDPKQSVYAFRGADIHTYLLAAQEARGATHTLNTNWRSDPLLIDGLNALFGRARLPFLYDEISYEPAKPRDDATNSLLDEAKRPVAPVQIRFLPRHKERLGTRGSQITKAWVNKHLPDMIAADIAALLNRDLRIDGRVVVPRDIAVLTRTNKQAHELHSALAARSIPTVLWGAESVFKSDEAEDLATLLTAIAAPTRTGRVRAALSTDLLGQSGDEIWRLAEDDDAWERWTQAFYAWHEQWRAEGFVRMIRSVLDFRPDGRGPSVGMRLLGLVGGERRLTNLRHLTELLHTATDQKQLGITGLLQWLRMQLTSEETPDGAQLRLENDESAVHLTTVHKAKGLEFSIVYCPYLFDGYSHSAKQEEVLFYDPAQGHTRTLDIGSVDLAAHRAIAVREERAESLRLLYVALTRAKHMSVIVWGAVADMAASPLGYLFHQHETARDLDSVRERLKKLSDPQLLADLAALEDAAPTGAIEISELEESTDGHLSRESVAEMVELSCRQRKRAIPRTLALSSFSSMVASGEPFDRVDADPVPSEKRGIPDTAAILLADFDRGPRAGDCFHTIFENLDFSRRDPAQLESVVSRTLTAFGFDATTWNDTICRAIEEILHTQLDAEDPNLILNAIPPQKRINELEFILPVVRNESTSPDASIAMQLRGVLIESGRDHLPDAYSRRVDELNLSSVTAGYLKGFIDLVFERDNRYYVVDYKSNYLGSRPEDYVQGRLEESMIKHDYYLQYLLYTVALHRFLEYRVPGYDYDTHFGDVFYLFLRGMSPRAGATRGVFRTRPSKQLISDLSAVFAGLDCEGTLP